MAILDILLLVVAFGGIVAIGYFSFRKFPFLSSLDTIGLKQLDESVRKEDMVTRRLKRKVFAFARETNRFFKPVGFRIERQIQGWIKSIERKEAEYQSRVRARKTNGDPAGANAARVALDEGTRLQASGEQDEAEQKFISAIGLAPQEPSGYTALGKYYMEKKEYTQAEQSFRHAVRLDPTNEEFYLDLIGVLRLMEKMDQAAALCQEAVRHAPNSPKVLNELLEVSIAMGDKSTAQLALKALAQTNPENQRLDELAEQVKALE